MSTQGQSNLQSWVEVFVNVAIGMAVSLISQLVLFPCIGVVIPMSSNLFLVGWFTVISVVRSYLLRRAFNRFHLWQVNNG